MIAFHVCCMIWPFMPMHSARPQPVCQRAPCICYLAALWFVSRMSHVSLQFDILNAMAIADRVTEATRVAMRRARTVDAQLATLTSAPWAADARATLEARLTQLEHSSDDVEE